MWASSARSFRHMHLLHAAFRRRVEDSRRHFFFDRPSTSVAAVTTSLIPDVLDYCWRDYGVLRYVAK